MPVLAKFRLLCGILSLLAISSGPLCAQEYTVDVQQFGLEEGIAHRSVKNIIKDKDGFLWLATDAGLQRYDGYEFKSFPIPKRYGQFTLFAQLEGGQIILFNVFSMRILFLDPLTGETMTKEEKWGIPVAARYDELVNEGYYLNVPARRKNWLYIKHSGGISSIDCQTGKEKRVMSNALLSENERIQLKFVDNKNNLWVWAKDSLVVINPQHTILNTFKKLLNTEEVGLSNLYEWKDEVYATVKKTQGKRGGGFYKLGKNGKQQLIFEAPLGFEIHQFLAGQFWCLGKSGWRVFDMSGSLVFELKRTDFDKKLFEGLDYKEIVTDPSGKFYLPTAFGFNIIEVRKNPFKRYLSNNKDKQIPISNSARGIHAENDSIVVNFESGGLILFPKNNPTDYTIISTTGLSPEMKGNSLYNGRPIVRGKGKGFWTGHMGYLSEWPIDLSLEKKRFFSEPYDGWNDVVWSLYEDKNGCIWSGRSKALSKKCPGEMAFENYNYSESAFGFQEFDIYQIQQGEKGLLWLCSTKGLFVFDEKRKKVVAHYHEDGNEGYNLPATDFFFMHLDKEGNKWFGTRSGLVFWNPKTGEKRLFNRNDGLTNEVIYAVFEDDFDRLWLSSDYGIMAFHKETFDVRAYLPKDGIAQEEFNRISHFQEADGTIYFGGLNGVTAFHPKDFVDKDKINASMVISDFEIFDGQEGKRVNRLKEVTETNTIIFQPDDHYFKLKFTLPTFDEKSKTLYGWKIEGVNDDWTYQKDNSLEFSALPYGHHTLNIKGQSAGGGWSPHELALQIQVLKPFYLTTWFLITVVLALIAGITFFFKARTRLLKKEIAKATATIADQAEELRILDKLKSRFFANVSHELRTPLSLMLGPIRLLRKNNDLDLDLENKKLLDFLERNTLHLKSLINEILDLSKLENNKMELEEEATRFHDFLTNHLNQFYSIGNSEKVNVVAKLSVSEDLNIQLDQNKFKKVINNFLSNAIKFSPPNGQAEVIVEEDESSLLVKVTDQGRGISAADLPYVFDRFYQAKNTDAPAEGGTGIGLSMCKELSQLMGGKVWVESIPGKGSTFFFSFPKKVTETVAIPASTQEEWLAEIENTSMIQAQAVPSIGIQQGAKILIAEDNKDLQEYYKIILSDYQVITTNHGQEALEYLQQNDPPDLILSDLMMPVMDGMQLLNKLKSSEQWWHIPVIMLTAKTNQEVKIQALRYGIDDYINKPFDEEELRVRIHNLLLHQKSRNVSDELGKDENELKLSKAELSWLEGFENYIIDNINNDRLSVSEICHAFGMSESSLLRKLKKITGLSPARYMTELKLNHAKTLIQSREFGSISEVAYQVGFKSIQAFSRSFKQRFGTSPTELSKA